MHVANVTDDVPLWQIARLVQDKIDDHGFVVAVEDVGGGMAILTCLESVGTGLDRSATTRAEETNDDSTM
jgi:hypothetical protein